MEKETKQSPVITDGLEDDKSFTPFVPPTERTMSNNIGKLALALAKAQGEVKTAVRDAKNPFFKHNYADLASVWDACRTPLAQNELAVIQTTEKDNGNIVLITTLVHSSGQWIRGYFKVKPVKSDPQGLGSALTYARRYALAAIVGVAPEGEDDDGNAATGKQAKASSNGKYTEAQKVIATRMWEYLQAEHGSIEDAGKALCSVAKDNGLAGHNSLRDYTGKQIEHLWDVFKRDAEIFEKQTAGEAN